MELLLRWCRQRSLVTTTLVGHMSMDQLQQSIDYFMRVKVLGDDVMWDPIRLPIFSLN